MKRSTIAIPALLAALNMPSIANANDHVVLSETQQPKSPIFVLCSKPDNDLACKDAAEAAGEKAQAAFADHDMQVGCTEGLSAAQGWALLAIHAKSLSKLGSATGMAAALVHSCPASYGDQALKVLEDNETAAYRIRHSQ